MDLAIIKPPFLITVYVIAAILLLAIAIRKGRSWYLRAGIGLAVGAIVGALVLWWFVDVQNVFGVELTPVVRTWVIFAFATSSLGLVTLWPSTRRVRTPWWRRILAVVAIVSFVLACTATINVDFGAYRTVKEALGISSIKKLNTSALHSKPSSQPAVDPMKLWATWQAPAGLPTKGKVGSVTIPATSDHYRPRAAVVYLPPAALVKNAPKLPVVVGLSGQPGAPSDLITAGQMAAVYDSYAAAHHGLAPILVIPDQLGAPEKNPMCVNSPLGNVEDYLTKDVPAWIKQNLNVRTDADAWTIMGFSEGGTCSIQLGAGHPEIFHNILDISGERFPTMGATTVHVAFHDNLAAYEAIKPVNVMKRKKPYPDTLAFFVAGQNDAKYTANEQFMSVQAKEAGMNATLLISPGTAHDFHTVQWGVTQSLPVFAKRFGLEQ